jgi:putative inorganic carbon (HCO3(-)) transporter
MGQTLLGWCNRIIAYSFYALFFFVPLIFTSQTSELFEFNKMWLTFGLTIIIAAVWFIKMIIERRIFLYKTPLDIPIILFLLSQIISTFYSLDTHISLWGYYSRFNGGLLSTISYIFLYYAFVSNYIDLSLIPKKNEQSFTRKLLFVLGGLFLTYIITTSITNEFGTPFYKDYGTLIVFFLLSLFLTIIYFSPEKFIKKIIIIGISSAVVVALWGIPSHFGIDPTCLIFRGNFTVSCWTDAFQPKVRIFSTIGQPAWLAAYLAILIPISLAIGLKNVKSGVKNFNSFLYVIRYPLYAILFFVGLLFTRTRSAFIGITLSLFIFLLLAFFKRYASKTIVGIVLLIFLLCTFFIGSGVSQLDNFSFSSLKNKLISQPVAQKPTEVATAGELGGTDSGQIRLIVWRGAIEAWKHNPIFGTGVETFAFAYYLHRPVEHNLTSEWDYLYNKAHNEYLNYLTTTGAVGLGTYALMILVFLFLACKYLFRKNHQDSYSLILILGLTTGYITILVTNFFGFSVVPINIFFYLIPAFVFILAGKISESKVISFAIFKETEKKHLTSYSLQTSQWISLFVVLVVSCYSLVVLLNFWLADVSYSKGYSLDRTGDYQTAYPYLFDAMTLRNNEPTYQDELSINNAILAAAYFQNKDATKAAQLANDAISYSNTVLTNHPNNVVYWKSRVRMFFALSQIEEAYTQLALKAIQQAKELAPTDAKVLYNLGLLYGQTGDIDKAIATFAETTRIKPDYRDAYYALGLYSHQKAINKKGDVVNKELQKKAVDSLTYILQHISPNDSEVKETLKKWGQP